MKNSLNTHQVQYSEKNTTSSSRKKGLRKSSQMLFALLLFSGAFLFQSCSSDDDNNNPLQSLAYQELRVEMRQLWADHMEWTYSTVDAFFHDEAGLDAKLTRLLLNQEHIGTSMKPYFGETLGEELTVLLTEHITDAVPVLSAAEQGDDAALAAALDDWYENAQEVGDHFASMNPQFWGQTELRDIWKTHISQTVTYSVDLLLLDLDKAVLDYQEAYDHMMGLSDILAKGIAEKFPEKF